MTDILDRIADKIDKKYSVRRLSDDTVEKVPVVKTRCLGFDYALRCGGVPKGRIIELFGNESGGKTTLSLMIADAFVRAGGAVLYIDAEHSLDHNYLKNMGINCDKIGLCQPDTLEEGLDIVQQSVTTASEDDKLLVVIDSVAALTPRKELENPMDKETIGLQARLLSKFFRKIKGVANRNKVTLLCINQVRLKVGVMWGNPETTPGGKALKFYSSIRIEVNRMETIKNKKNKPIGIRSKVKIVKNKIGCPFYQTEIEMRGGLGVDYTLNTYEAMKDNNLLNGRSIEDIRSLFGTKKMKKLRRKLMEA